MHLPPTIVCLSKLDDFDGVKSVVELEYSVHQVSRFQVTECLTVFPQLPKDEKSLLCVPTFQKADADMVDYTKQAESEKNRLLQSFVQWGKCVCEYVLKRNQWADCIDPCSGLPLLTTQGSSCYSEVDGMQTLLKYKLQQVGDCSVIVHPRWGTRVYPASLFSTAPLKLLLEAINFSNDRFASVSPPSAPNNLLAETTSVDVILGGPKRKRSFQTVESETVVDRDSKHNEIHHEKLKSLVHDKPD